MQTLYNHCASFVQNVCLHRHTQKKTLPFARERDVRDLAAVTGSRGSSTAIPADCILVEVCIEFERLATGANTMPLQCFAGCALLCAYGLKRWGDVLHVHVKSFDLPSESLVVET